MQGWLAAAAAPAGVIINSVAQRQPLTQLPGRERSPEQWS